MGRGSLGTWTPTPLFNYCRHWGHTAQHPVSGPYLYCTKPFWLKIHIKICIKRSTCSPSGCITTSFLSTCVIGEKGLLAMFQHLIGLWDARAC